MKVFAGHRQDDVYHADDEGSIDQRIKSSNKDILSDDMRQYLQDDCVDDDKPQTKGDDDDGGQDQLEDRTSDQLYGRKNCRNNQVRAHRRHDGEPLHGMSGDPESDAVYRQGKNEFGEQFHYG